jgi:hypothetical protein
MPRLNEARPRSSYLGATDIAAIAGVSPYRTPFEVYLEKIGELDPAARETDVDRDRKERGHRFEDVALDWYAEANGIAIERVRRDIVHRDFPFIVVHPDARVRPWRPALTLIEAKTGPRVGTRSRSTSRRRSRCRWPRRAPSAHVACRRSTGRRTRTRSRTQPELIAALEELAVAFWRACSIAPAAHRSVARRESLPRSNVARRATDDGRRRPACAAGAPARHPGRGEAPRGGGREPRHRAQAVDARRVAPQAPGIGFGPLDAAYRAPHDGVEGGCRGVPSGVIELAKLPGAQAASTGSGCPIPTFESLHSRVEEGVRQFRPTPWKNQEEAAA